MNAASVSAAAGCLTLITTGSYLFVSAVDSRTLLALSDNNAESTLKALLPIWWPAGRDFMVPCGALQLILQAAAWRLTEDNKCVTLCPLLS